MATVYIPSMLTPLTDGRASIEVAGATIGELVGNLSIRYPRLAGRLVLDGEIRSSISVAIDGEISTLGLLETVEEEAEVHFVPAIAGGMEGSDAVPVG